MNSLISILLNQSIESALVLPYRNAPDVTMHLELRSREGHVVISSEAMDVSDGGEAFYLVASQLDLRDWWAQQARATWKPRDLVMDWAGSALAKLLAGPRRARFFYDSADRQLGLTESGMFDGAAAIELSSSNTDCDAKVVLYASPEITFSIEIATSADRQRIILHQLTEFYPKDFSHMG